MKVLPLLIVYILLITGCGTVRPWTTEEKMMLGLSCLAVAADAYTTMEGMNMGNSETNPIMGKHPSNGTIISVMAITQMVTIIGAHYWESMRLWILGVKTGANAVCIFHNMRENR